MTITREQLLETLYTNWGTFVDRFQRLSPEAQARYLQQQGYARFADLLAHVIAWWREGLPAIPTMLNDPNYASPEHEVDLFNARAVASFRDLDEPAVAAIFENLREQWLALVSSLSPEAFQHHQIADRLHIEIIGHFAEHRPD
jgi:hypothetical protein